MSDVINIKDHQPLRPIAEFTLYLNKQGEPVLRLTWAEKEFIEDHDTISERFLALKRLIDGSLIYLDELAEGFKENE